MENSPSNNNDNEESKKIVNNFKNELEKIKQKLNKDFYKYSQIEKEKNKNNNIVNFHYMNNSRNEPNKNENEYNELKEDIKIAKENIDNIINRTEEKDEKTTTEKTNSNTSIFTKIPSLEELKMKYGINLNNKPSSIKEITIETNMSKFNRKKDKDKDKDLSNIQKKNITEKSELNDNKIINEDINNFNNIKNNEIIHTDINNINNIKDNEIIQNENNILNNNVNNDNKINVTKIEDKINLDIFHNIKKKIK